MRALIIAFSLMAIATAGVIVVIAIWAEQWMHALVGGVWLFLVCANFREWVGNAKRRQGFHQRQIDEMHADQIKWVESVMLAKSLAAGRYADRLGDLGLSNDAPSVAMLGKLFDEIAKVELPEGSRDEVVQLQRKAAEAANVCRAGSIPRDRVLH